MEGIKKFSECDRMVSEVVNVGKLFRMAARPFYVQPSAVQEYISRVIDYIEDNVPCMVALAERDGRKTIYEGDVIKYLSGIGCGVV